MKITTADKEPLTIVEADTGIQVEVKFRDTDILIGIYDKEDNCIKMVTVWRTQFKIVEETKKKKK